MIGGLCGLSSKIRTRTLGGLLGIVGIISYFKFVYYETAHSVWLPFFEMHNFPGSASEIYFLSAGFYLAIAGSLMLLLPLIRTLIERLRKRL